MEKYEKKPTSNDCNLSDEFVYAFRIVDVLKNVDFNKNCDVEESIRTIHNALLEYKNKILKDYSL